MAPHAARRSIRSTARRTGSKACSALPQADRLIIFSSPLGSDPSGAVIAGRVNFLIGWPCSYPIPTSRRNIMAAHEIKLPAPATAQEPEKMVTLQKSTCKVTVPESVGKSFEEQGFTRVD
jgi:hypothetical protein